MTVLATRSTPEDSRSADWLWIAAHSVLGSVPVVMAVASRASTLVLIIAAALTVAAILAEGRLRQWLAEAVAALTSPLGLAILAFLGFAALSITWSAAPASVPRDARRVRRGARRSLHRRPSCCRGACRNAGP